MGPVSEGQALDPAQGSIASTSADDPSLLFTRPVDLAVGAPVASQEPGAPKPLSGASASQGSHFPQSTPELQTVPWPVQLEQAASRQGLSFSDSTRPGAEILTISGEPLRPFCRICFEGEAGEALIAPCRCRGTQKYVHRTCLDSWRAAKEGYAFAHCTECRAAFVLRAQVPPDRKWKQLKFRTCVAMDHLLLFLTVQVIVGGISYLIYSCFGSNLQTLFGYDDRPDAFTDVVAVVTGAVGILYGFFISIICSEYIEHRHLQILQRKPLTYEYFVEDLESPTIQSINNLKPEHEQELVSMGLLRRS